MECKLEGEYLAFQFNQFESNEDCTCVNREFFLFGSGQKSFRVYILHTLISFLKILPVLSQKICDLSSICEYFLHICPCVDLDIKKTLYMRNLGYSFSLLSN